MREQTTSPYGASFDQNPVDASTALVEAFSAIQRTVRGILEGASALDDLVAKSGGVFRRPLDPPVLPDAFLQPPPHLRKAPRGTLPEDPDAPVPPLLPNLPNDGYPRLQALIQRRGFITNVDVREAFNLTSTQATFRLKDMVAAKILIQNGTRRGARYSTGPRWPAL
ncbi:MAG: hypothetical protein KA712_08895 [Myxococcales bacterium]|nr:hypothetical protein [Myxococcales bacterium]